MDSLFNAARDCLRLTDPAEKIARTAAVAAAWRAGTLSRDSAAAEIECAETVAGRPPRPQLVPPRQLPQRGLGTPAGRAALLHAVAHIEFNAINLAWDAVYRFRDMPRAYYDDWVGVAADEARHFSLVAARLRELDTAYGDLDAHNGLWDMACKTQHAVLARMALVPRVLEARGLDVTPGMIQRLTEVGDTASVAVLVVILREEVAHVAAGTRWFEWCCAAAGLVPGPTFERLLVTHMGALPRPPFNREARRAAGFDDADMDRWQGAAG
ncbi:MAG TPA: ferritin-like domain-containing protein [Rhodanobacteraceae bacterium]|nr:ferritin-like domain-containing protein [Rhodanobacteraceae bacterium]